MGMLIAALNGDTVFVILIAMMLLMIGAMATSMSGDDYY